MAEDATEMMSPQLIKDEESIPSVDSYLSELTASATLIKKCKQDIDYLFQLAGVTGVYNYRLETINGDADSCLGYDFEKASQEVLVGLLAESGDEGDQDVTIGERTDEEPPEEREILVPNGDTVMAVELDFEEDDDDGTDYNIFGPSEPESDARIDVKDALLTARESLKVLMDFENVTNEKERSRRLFALSLISCKATGAGRCRGTDQ